MPSVGTHSRFEAKMVTRLVTVVGQRCFEMHFVDAQGDTQVLTLPLAEAVALGCLICDAVESTPFLFGSRCARRTEFPARAAAASTSSSS